MLGFEKSCAGILFIFLNATKRNFILAEFVMVYFMLFHNIDFIPFHVLRANTHNIDDGYRTLLVQMALYVTCGG